MTDGGSFNGYSVAALGLAKVALIEYEAMTSLLTSAADYNDLFNALQQACVDLVGTNGHQFGDCHSVQQAVRATEMDRLPVSGGPRSAAACPSGSYVRTTFMDDFEDAATSAATWHSHVIHGSRDTWYYPQNPNNDADLGWHVGIIGSAQPVRRRPADGHRLGHGHDQGGQAARRCTSPVRAWVPIRCRLEASLRRRGRRDQRRRRDVAGCRPVHRPGWLHGHHHQVDREPAPAPQGVHGPVTRLGLDTARPVIPGWPERAHPVPGRHGSTRPATSAGTSTTSASTAASPTPRGRRSASPSTRGPQRPPTAWWTSPSTPATAGRAYPGCGSPTAAP